MVQPAITIYGHKSIWLAIPPILHHPPTRQWPDGTEGKAPRRGGEKERGGQEN